MMTAFGGPRREPRSLPLPMQETLGGCSQRDSTKGQNNPIGIIRLPGWVLEDGRIIVAREGS
jgi:hypothetical protein